MLVSFMLDVAYKCFMLGVVMLNVAAPFRLHPIIINHLVGYRLVYND